MQRLHGSPASLRRGIAPLDSSRRHTYLTDREGHSDPKDRTMADNTAQPLSITARKLAAQADAVLDQMFGYFTREEAPRVIETRRAA